MLLPQLTEVPRKPMPAEAMPDPEAIVPQRDLQIQKVFKEQHVNFDVKIFKATLLEFIYTVYREAV